MAGQFVQIGLFHEVFFVDQHHAGDIHFGSHFRGACRAGDIGRVQRLVQLGVQPALQLAVVIQFGELPLDQLSLALIHMAVGLGCCNQRLENALAVLLDLGRWQAVDGLRLALGRIGLIGLPVAVGLVGNDAQCGQPAVGQGFAAEFARLLVAHQQAHGTGCQGAATGTAKQAAQPSAAKQSAQGAFVVLLALAASLALQHVLAGLEQLIEQSTGIHS